VYWEAFEQEGLNPKTGESSLVKRRRLRTDLELPMGNDYDEFIRAILAGGQP
jgi:hypothetical protein